MKTVPPRGLPLLNRAVELTPAAQACCGACRTCVTTNVVTLALAAAGGATLALRRLVTRATTAD